MSKPSCADCAYRRPLVAPSARELYRGWCASVFSERCGEDVFDFQSCPWHDTHHDKTIDAVWLADHPITR